MARGKINPRKPAGRAPAPRRRNRAGNRSRAPEVLGQGVGSITKQAFGGRDATNLHCWDARLPHHLALPRAVGPYTIVRTTLRINTAASCLVFGTFQSGTNVAQHRGHWNNLACFTVAPTDATHGPLELMNASNNTVAYPFDFSSMDKATTICPAAYSVQLMNPESLQTTSGIVYQGVMHTQAALADRSESWFTYLNKFVQYQAPRLMSAGKLALRGTQCSSYPLNMGEVSRFTPSSIHGGGAFTWSSTQSECVGWAPILVLNPNEVELEYLVTCEWRVRFDLDNPAAASHRHHPIATDQTWDKLMRMACSLGNGVQDIAEVVANTGVAAGKIAALMT